MPQNAVAQCRARDPRGTLVAMDVDEVTALLRSRRQWERDGLTSRQLGERVRRGELHRLDHGWYVDADEWASRYGEERHLMRVVAASARRTSGTRLVFSHYSAAVLWGLPLARVDPRRVHVSGATASGHVDGGDPTVARHQVTVAPGDIAAVQGHRCTSLARTVADVLRVATEETGIALADAALRRVAWDERNARYDSAEAERLTAEVAARLPLGGRGVRRARLVLSLADGRAQLPGESISRLYLLRLGFDAPRLQVAVPAPSGRQYLVKPQHVV